MSTTTTIRLGTRGSSLARWQADWIAAQLKQLGCQVEMHYVTTKGDARSEPIGSIGGQGLFTKEIQRALLDGTIDVAVHSLKDLPTEAAEGLQLAAIPPRESPGDALICRTADSLAALPQAARVGTGSLRRQAQLLHARPDLQVADIRGNVETRLRKLDEGQFDAIVLAEAGLRRLELEQRITQLMPRDLMLPAVGQGALGVEIRADDQRTADVLAPLDDAATRQSVLAERSMLATLRGGCLAPVGAWGRIEQGVLTLDGVVLSSDGQQRVATRVEGPSEAAEQLGRQAAQQLLDQGAADLISAARG